MTGRVSLAIIFVECAIAWHDVGWVGDDAVIAAFGQQFLQLLDVFGEVGVHVDVFGGRFGAERGKLLLPPRGLAFGVASQRCVPQRIATDKVDFVLRCIFQFPFTAGSHRGQQQSKPCDGDRVGVHIDAVDAVERSLHEHASLLARLFLLPTCEDAREGTEQKVAAATRRVNHFEVVVSCQLSVFSFS